MILHRATNRSRRTAQLIACQRLPRAQSGSILAGCLRWGTKSANLKTALFPMKLRFPLLTAIIAVALISGTPPPLQAKSDAEQICVSAGRLLEEGHYAQQQLNAELAETFRRS